MNEIGRDDLTIRNMRIVDIGQVVALENKTESFPWSEQLFLGEFDLPENTRKWLVASVDLKIIGYIGIMLAYDEATLMKITVDSDYRRNAIATKMLKKLLRELSSDIKNVYLEVRESNFAAIALYEKFNFYEIGIREKYFEDGENAILMGLVHT